MQTSLGFVDAQTKEKKGMMNVDIDLQDYGVISKNIKINIHNIEKKVCRKVWEIDNTIF